MSTILHMFRNLTDHMEARSICKKVTYHFPFYELIACQVNNLFLQSRYIHIINCFVINHLHIALY